MKEQGRTVKQNEEENLGPWNSVEHLNWPHPEMPTFRILVIEGNFSQIHFNGFSVCLNKECSMEKIIQVKAMKADFIEVILHLRHLATIIDFIL